MYTPDMAESWISDPLVTVQRRIRDNPRYSDSVTSQAIAYAKSLLTTTRSDMSHRTFAKAAVMAFAEMARLDEPTDKPLTSAQEKNRRVEYFGWLKDFALSLRLAGLQAISSGNGRVGKGKLHTPPRPPALTEIPAPICHPDDGESDAQCQSA